MTQTAYDYYDHPVFNPRQLLLETSAMRTLREGFHRWLWTGVTGGVITGPSRAGKTTAALAIKDQLRTRDRRSIPAHYTSIPRRDQSTVLSVFRNLCLSEDLKTRNTDRSDHLSDRYVHYILDRAAQNQCAYAVLIIDEMQRLHPRQYDAFAEIYDKLSLFDIDLTVVFFGNDQECQNLIKVIKTPAFAHIHGRFFTQHLPFNGLTSEKQVNHCLHQYDGLRFPPDGPTYTEYFLPDEYKRGWRLASLSRLLWSVFRDYQKTYHIRSWGMQYFAATVNILLVDFLPRLEVLECDEETIHECIRLSGLIPSLVHSIK